MQKRDRLGEFQLLRELGRGGMGIVYLARQESLGRLVALKVMPEGVVEDPGRLERFHLEAEVISRLDHPSIVPVFAVGEDDGIHYIAMKYLDGTTVDEMIRRRRPTGDLHRASPDSDTMVLRSQDRVPARFVPRRDPLHERTARSTESEPGWVFRALRIVERVARALHHAHENGVIHRDVKPSNILIDGKGHPWLLDFGLVRDLACEGFTETDGFLGTAWYMSPEQVRRDRDTTDHRADVYSLGVTLYELVTLRRPIAYERPDTLFHAIVNEEPIRPRRRNPALPKDLETVILKAMAKDPSARYGSAEEFAEDLRRVRSFEPVVARPVSVVGRARRWIHRNPMVAGAFLFGILSFVGMVEYSVYRDLLDQRRARVALDTADDAYQSGEWGDALQNYQLYIALGGDADIVGPRLEDAMVRLARPPPILAAARSRHK
ncbi:MAG: hypothetical protein CL908_15900 [Deltaproteobacteria bacterium]|nr:hypothetical protein [Deltaproteobacteria bacterium]